MSTLQSDPEVFVADVRRVAQEVAALHAGDVDANARFPHEAVDALREIGALAAYVPTEYGGAGLGLPEMASACYHLGRSCAATAMIFAMHQLQIANIVRHVDAADAWHLDYLSRVSAEQRLVASCTTELGTGGDMGRSIAAVQPGPGGEASFEKQTPTMSYSAYADDILMSLRRAPDAEESDQVMVLVSRDQYTLEPTGVWDTLGMRGTCSPGVIVRGHFAPEQILAQPFATMMSETIVPISHIMWANLWLGLGTEAFERGRTFVRAAARRSPGAPVPAARKLSEVLLDLRLVRAEIESAGRDFASWDASEDRAELRTFTAGLRFNALKLAVSERVPEICLATLSLIGVMAYKNDSPFAIGRLLRDALSAQVMIANERIHTTNAGLIPLAKEG